MVATVKDSASSRKLPITLGISFILFLTTIFFANTNAASGQSKPKGPPPVKGIEKIPLESQARLFERVRTYVRAEHGRDWATQYDMKPPELKPDELKESYVARFRRMEKDGELFQLLDFEVSEITLLIATADHSAGRWMVSGCALYHKQYQFGSESYSSSMEVRLDEKEWFIASIGPDAVIDGPPADCRFHRKRGLLASK